MVSAALGGKRNWAGAEKCSIKLVTEVQNAYEDTYQQRRGMIPAIRDTWLSTEDQGLDFGIGNIRDSGSTLANFFWTDHKGTKHKVSREKIPYTGNTSNDLNAGPIAQRVKKLVDAAMTANAQHVQPPRHLVLFEMAKLLLKPHPQKPHHPNLYQHLETASAKRTNSKYFAAAAAMGSDVVRMQKDNWLALQHEYDRCSQDVKDGMTVIDKLWKPKASITTFEQYERDKIAAADEDILMRIPDDVIYLLVDANDGVLIIRWAKALQWFYGDEFVPNAAATIKKYVSHEPPRKPKPQRHVIHEEWLRKNPQFDHKVTRGATSGTLYFGVGHEQGHWDKFAVLDASKGAMDKVFKKPAKAKQANEMQRCRYELMAESFLPAVTRAHMFVQEILDPKLLKQQQKVVAAFPDLMARTVPDDPYSLHALLVNTLTTDHLDRADWHRGFAMMSTFGEFDGADLCLRQLGRRMGYGAGTIAAIKGHEMHHCTTSWTGERSSIINVNQTFSRRMYAQKLEQEQGVESLGAEDLEVLNAKEDQAEESSDEDTEDDEADGEDAESKQGEDEGSNTLKTSRKRARCDTLKEERINRDRV